MTAHDADKKSGHGKDSDMKMRLVPSEATEEMFLNTVDERRLPTVLKYTTPDERSKPFLMPRYIYRAMLAAAPHAGKVSAEMLEAAKVRVRDNFRCGASVDGETVYCNDERLPANIRCQSCECGDVARAVLEAIGLEVEE